MNRAPKSLKNTLALTFILIATLPIFLISFFTLQLLNDKISNQIMEKNQTTADSLAAQTMDFLSTADKVVQQVADGVEFFGIEEKTLVQQYLVLMMKNFSYFDSIQVINEQGIVVMMAPDNADYVGNSIAGRSYYKNVGVTRQSSWSTTFMSPMNGQPTITLVHPMKEGMIVANLNLGTLNQIVAQANKLADGWIGITDKEGTYIGHTNVEEVAQRTNVKQFAYSKMAMNGEEGSQEYSYHGMHYLISVVSVQPIGWSIIVGQNAETAFASLKTARSIFMSGTFISLIIALLVAIWLLGKILKPILALVKNMQAVAVGKYQVMVGAEGYEELVDLARAFHIMAEAVALREKALINNKKELEISLQKLESSNQELDQFAYVASHDLKAPLRAIMNLSQWLEEDLVELVDDSAKEKLGLLRSRAQRMENLIVGILEYSRVGRVKSKNELIDIKVFLQDISHEFAGSSTFSIVIGAWMPRVVANRIQLWQVFSNLISNAIKHHHQQEGIIHITAIEKKNFYEFSVADNGPGVDMAQHEKIFQIFQTLKPRDQFESTGVGLAIVQKIIRQQGGNISIRSEEGQGATFIFTWPKEIREEIKIQKG